MTRAHRALELVDEADDGVLVFGAEGDGAFFGPLLQPLGASRIRSLLVLLELCLRSIRPLARVAHPAWRSVGWLQEAAVQHLSDGRLSAGWPAACGDEGVVSAHLSLAVVDNFGADHAIAGADQQRGRRRSAVASCAPGLLRPRRDARWRLKVDHRADVWSVDPHAPRRGGDHHRRSPGGEGLRGLCAGAWGPACVIPSRRDASFS